MPVARLPKLSDRTSGVLLHPTSLPGGGENGDLGAEARAFVDFLADAGQSWWQMLPVGPTGYANSPYSAQSAFAGNPALIDTERLIADGYLSEKDRPLARAEQLTNAFLAHVNGGGRPRDFQAFVKEARPWLEDFAVYRAIKRLHGEAQWTLWPAPLRDRDPAALRRFRAEHPREIDFVRFVQWRFARDWQALRAHAHARGIGLIGDIPIFMAHDSADVWKQRALYHLDRAGEATLISGVPPDYFSETGQRWGNPLYRWDRMRKNGYAWWIERFRATLAGFDAIRLDHFIGFSRYWAIPGGEPTAVNGKWRRGPGAHFFKAVRRALRAERLPLIAEDLGVVTAEVRALRDTFGLPGIKVLQFAFGTDPNAPDFLPHNYPRNAVAYTGTHDNDTTAGWFHDPGSGTRSAEQTEKERRVALGYLGHESSEATGAAAREIHWQMIRMILMSVANVAIVPAQDLLGLGSEARMNRPGTDRGNWAFRLAADALSPAIANRLRGLCTTYDRVRAAA
ncbi:MAG TPA: 4-alpha-glucanotransferase [Polyangia bacterium]|nr:4-alpha-glucanotransferase [Polyangia bacterium]